MYPSFFYSSLMVTLQLRILERLPHANNIVRYLPSHLDKLEWTPADEKYSSGYNSINKKCRCLRRLFFCLLCLALFFMAAGCLAICCYAMILSYYSDAVSWYCNVRTLKWAVTSLSSNCYFAVIVL